MSLDKKRHFVHLESSPLSIVLQYEILEMHGSGIYFSLKHENVLNLHLIRLFDGKFLDCRFYGVTRMTTWIREDMGYFINPKRIERLYKLMGLQTICTKKNLSKRNRLHKVYTYLLKNLKLVIPNQVWQTDIKYIPLNSGFMYMIAIIYVYSRKV
jgi:putative transposase